MRHVSLARASLLALILSASTAAFATCNPDEGGCGGQSHHTTSPAVVPALTLSSSATQNTQGSWDYVYTLSRTGNETGVLLYLGTLTLPYFEDGQITDLRSTVADSPVGPRTVDIVTSATGAQSIVSSTWASLYWGDDLTRTPEDLRFTSPFAPGAQGTAVVALEGMLQFGADAYGNSFSHTIIAPPPMSFAVTLPGSPLALAATVPEPASIASWTIGLLAMVGLSAMQRRRREGTNRMS